MITQTQLDKTLDDSGLNYEVKTYQEKSPFTGEDLRFRGTYRTDNNHVIKTGLTKSYKTIQNKDAFKSLIELSEVSDVELVKAGVWKEGAEAWAQIDINGGAAIGGSGSQDRVANRVTFFNAHDGTSRCTFIITPYRYFCRNQLAASLRHARAEVSKYLAVTHTASGEDKLKILAKQYKVINGIFQETVEEYNTLADTKIGKAQVQEVLNRLYPCDEKTSPRTATINKEAQATIANLYADADDGKIAWDTAWNLYNSCTNFTNHHKGGYQDKDRSLLLSSGAMDCRKSLEVIEEVCLDGILNKVDVKGTHEASAVENILNQISE